MLRIVTDSFNQISPIGIINKTGLVITTLIGRNAGKKLQNKKKKRIKALALTKYIENNNVQRKNTKNNYNILWHLWLSIHEKFSNVTRVQINEKFMKIRYLGYIGWRIITFSVKMGLHGLQSVI